MTDEQLVSYGTIYDKDGKEYKPNTPVNKADFDEEAWEDHVEAGMVVPASQHPWHDEEVAEEHQNMSAAVTTRAKDETIPTVSPSGEDPQEKQEQKTSTPEQKAPAPAPKTVPPATK